MGFLTVIPGRILAQRAHSPISTKVSRENHVRELLLDLYCPEIGVTVRGALAVIRDCSINKSSLVTSPRLRFTRELNLLGIFVEIASPDEELDVPLYLLVLDVPKLLKAHPDLTEFKAILETVLEFG